MKKKIKHDENRFNFSLDIKILILYRPDQNKKDNIFTVSVANK